MKFTLIGPVYPYRGGIAWFTTSLGQELLNAGHQVQVLSFSRQYPSWLYPGKSDKDPSQQFVQVPAQYILDPLYPHTWMRTIREIYHFQPQLVIIQWWTTFWAPAFWLIAHFMNRRKIPVAYVIHNVMPHEARFFDRWLVHGTLKHGNALVYLSPQEGERLKKLLPKIQSYSAHLPLFRIGGDRMERSAARVKLGLPDQSVILLFFGLVRPYKGLEILIKSLGELRKEGILPYLLVVGEFWESVQSYLKLIDELGLIDQVRIIDRFIPNEEVGLYFSAADIFVAPYIDGTQSGSIKVAMAYRLPILASDRVVSDLPLDRYPILTHAAGDVRSLAATIRKYIEEPPALVPEQNTSESFEVFVNTLENISLSCSETL